MEFILLNSEFLRNEKIQVFFEISHETSHDVFILGPQNGDLGGILGTKKPKYSMVWLESYEKVVIYHNVAILSGGCGHFGTSKMVILGVFWGPKSQNTPWFG